MTDNNFMFIESSHYINFSDKNAFRKQINQNFVKILQVFGDDRSTFQPDTKTDINGIIECLQELENERLKAHEIWETESIKFEALRNKLIQYPTEITEEIQRAIKAARGLNEETIKKLKENLEKINDNIARHSNELDGFNAANENLIPDLEQMKIDHEKIVVHLNKHLSKKADKQIELNVLRNTIKAFNENIVELEEDIFNFKETMISERSKGREEKKRLIFETTQTQKMLDIQNKKNDELNTIYQNLKHEATETALSAKNKLAINQKFVKTLEQMMKRQNACEESIENISYSNEQIRQKILQTETNINDSKHKFDLWKSQIGERIDMFSENIEIQEQILSELTGVKERVSEELENSEKNKDDESIKLRALLDKLKTIDEKGAAKVSDIGQLEYEMDEMTRDEITNKENHEAAVSGIKSQMENLKKQLEKERRERNDVQRENADLQDQINSFRGEHVKFMRDINNKINDRKSEHARLSSLYQQLQKTIKEEVDASKKLKGLITEENLMYNEEKTDLSEKINFLTKKISEMEDIEIHKRTQLEESEPSLIELRIYYEKRSKDYDNLKKDIVGLRSRKSGLEDAINRATKAIEKEQLILEKLQEDKTFKERKLDTQLRMEAKDRSEIEKQIYVSGCKMSTVKEEICRLQHEINKMDDRTRLLRDHWEKAIHISSRLKLDINGQKFILQKGWEQDLQLENTFKDDEITTINRLKDLLKNTEERQLLVADISDKLFNEICLFDQFIFNMGSVSNGISDKIGANKKFINAIAQISTFNKVIKAFDKIDENANEKIANK